ncbi:MAG TPA: hypothetical protein VHU15_05605 [Stellaceae bacterium]|jgi:hypothetical protein|nr:hypothetical protein [Stellaceae bacterium]
MRRLLIIVAASLIGIGLPSVGYADGLPSCPCPPLAKAKVKVKTVHHVRHRRFARGPIVVGLPGPYDLHAAPPSPLDSAYQPAMVAYFRDPSITGYWPGSAAAYVGHDDAGYDTAAAEHVDGVFYHRTGSPIARALLPPPAIDNFPFRKYDGAIVREYDGVIGEYVQLSARDAALAIRVANVKPVPFLPAVPR